MDAPALHLDHEQHIQPSQADRFDREEATPRRAGAS
jgi:hypothetical protein